MVSKPRWRLDLPTSGSEAGEQVGESQVAALAMSTDTQEALFLGRTDTVYTGSTGCLGFRNLGSQEAALLRCSRVCT